MVVRVEVGGESSGVVQRLDLALELVFRGGDWEDGLAYFPVDDTVFVWDWLIPPRLQGWFSRCCSWLSRFEVPQVPQVPPPLPQVPEVSQLVQPGNLRVDLPS